jgi:hypothetical protein
MPARPPCLVSWSSRRKRRRHDDIYPRSGDADGVLAALHHVGGEAAPVGVVGRISNARQPAAGQLLISGAAGTWEEAL